MGITKYREEEHIVCTEFIVALFFSPQNMWNTNYKEDLRYGRGGQGGLDVIGVDLGDGVLSLDPVAAGSSVVSDGEGSFPASFKSAVVISGDVG